MEYKLKIEQTDFSVEVIDQHDRQLNLRLGDGVYEVEYEVVADHWIHMAVNVSGRTGLVNAWVMDGSEGKIIVINGRTYTVQDLDQLTRRVPKGRGANLPDQITPPMPAVVVAVPVAEGERVKKGQAVMVVSAMKMETTLCAPFDGVVAKINATVNDKVAPGQILVEITKDTDLTEDPAGGTNS